MMCIIYYAYKDPKTPLFAKMLASILIGYAASPIDLIPDFIPIIGYLDDLIILSLGVFFLIKLIPKEIWDKNLELAENRENCFPHNNWLAGVIILFIWVTIIFIFLILLKII